MGRGKFCLRRGGLCAQESPGLGRLQEMMATNEGHGEKQHETYVCFLLRASFQEKKHIF